MALDITKIELRRELTIYAILKVAYMFYPAMFWDYTNAAGPSTIGFTSLTNCTDNYDGSLTPTGSPFSFKVNSSSGILITVSMVGTSVQIPDISVSRIKAILGVSTGNLAGLNTSSSINNGSPTKPNSSQPHQLSEWIGYYHGALSGCYFHETIPPSAVDFGANFTVSCLAAKYYGIAPAGYGWGNSRLDLYKQGSLIQTGSVASLATANYIETISGTLTNNAGGLTASVDFEAKFYMWNGSAYAQIGSDYVFYVSLRGSPLIFSYQSTLYSVKVFNGNISINNQTSSGHTYTIRFQLKRSGSILETKTRTQVVGQDTTYSGAFPVTMTNTMVNTDTVLVDISQDGGAYQFQAEHSVMGEA